ncbi:MAG: methionine aminotransferase [Ginsengibacter sp.]
MFCKLLYLSSPPIISKLPNTGETIFAVMNSLANEYKAINLGQGFPDFAMNSELVNLVDKAMKEGHNQYAHMNGVPSLRNAIAEKIKFLYEREIDPGTEITVTPGGTYALYNAFTAVLNPGDEVIIFEPAFDSYIPNIEINGATPVLLPLTFPGYKIDWDMVRKKITAKTKMIVLNSPHNPTGSILDANDIDDLRKVVQGTNIFILSDEVYEHIIFDSLRHESMLKYPELFERSFVCFSFGKVYNCTGWKLGYCVAPEVMMKEFRKVHQFNCFSCNAPMQHAIAEFLQQKDQYLGLGKFLQSKRDFFTELMKETSFTPLPSFGSYFQLYSYHSLSDEDEVSFAVRLAKEAGIVAVPVSAFYKSATNNYVLRFCFVKQEQTLIDASRKLKNFSDNFS